MKTIKLLDVAAKCESIVSMAAISPYLNYSLRTHYAIFCSNTWQLREANL